MIIPSTTNHATSSTPRIKRGTKLSDIEPPSSLPQLSSLDGPFQLSEYLALKVQYDPHDIRGLVEVPEDEGKGPGRDVWIYEHLRRIPIDLTPLLTTLLKSCTPQSCSVMKADEWLYLCVAHGGGGTEGCSAIDYILHTLDSSTALLNSTKNFPSRLQIPQPSLTHFPSLFRRLSRIFSHAYYHHREAFSLAEAETSLYARFVALCERYELVGKSLLVVPKEAYDHEDIEDEDEKEDEKEKENGVEENEDADEDEDEEEEEDDDDEDNEEGEEEDNSVSEAGIGRERGRDNESDTGGRRTKSLDRERRVEIASRARERDLLRTEKTEPPATMSRSGTVIGRGTLGKGKQPRGTMLWSSDDSVMKGDGVEPGLLEGEGEGEGRGDGVNGVDGLELERTSSQEKAIHVGPDPEGAEDAERAGEGERAGVEETGSEAHGEVGVPKDEIELLEEQGVIPPETAVSPLKPSTGSGKEADVEMAIEGDGEVGEMEEVGLDEE